MPVLYYYYTSNGHTSIYQQYCTKQNRKYEYYEVDLSKVKTITMREAEEAGMNVYTSPYKS